MTCLVTLFDRKLQVFKKSPKLTIFGILMNFATFSLIFKHCALARYKRRPLSYWIYKEFHQKVSRAWKQEKALAFCTHIDFFCIKIISVKKSNIQEQQLRKKSVIRYLQLHLKYHLKEKSWKHFSLFFSNLSMSFLQS